MSESARRILDVEDLSRIVEPERPRTAEPAVFKKQAQFVGMIGLLMDVIVAVVLIAFEPFEQPLTYILATVLVGAGGVLAYLFAVVFPRRYESNYERKYGPKLH